ncbi:MAG TPA: elongation factor Ts [Candidatus Saccharibacteria bacterium]|nr:elongation factor Ts [Candidatus Saccharibacteria bacterium]HRQ06908.1 elongation factor Ts [Candidatus Saccharibacteria bacterium]
MSVSIDDIRKLKELTGVGLTDAKVALVEAGGDFDKALTAMRKKGVTKAEKKGDREAREGIIDGYVHGGRIGVLVEVNCETDFVARTDGFKEFAHEIALQVASMSPEYISEADIPAAELKRVRDEALASDALKAKSAEMAEKIVDGQVKKHFADKVLLNQVYIKNEKQTVADFVKENIAKTGENLVIRQFKRIELGVSE